MRVVKGMREWLVCWAGYDDDGMPWKPSWEPTKFVSKSLVQEFLSALKERVYRLIEVDTRPLDSLVQRSIAQAAMKETGASFGREHSIEVGALTLRDLAVHYFDGVVRRFELKPQYVYAPDGNVLTVELQIKDPNAVGVFCSFENFMPKNTGVGALRYALGRASNTDASVVSPIHVLRGQQAHPRVRHVHRGVLDVPHQRRHGPPHAAAPGRELQQPAQDRRLQKQGHHLRA